MTRHHAEPNNTLLTRNLLFHSLILCAIRLPSCMFSTNKLLFTLKPLSADACPCYKHERSLKTQQICSYSLVLIYFPKNKSTRSLLLLNLTKSLLLAFTIFVRKLEYSNLAAPAAKIFL